MSRTLTLELSDEAFRALRRRADADGTSPERTASAALERQLTEAPSSPVVADAQAARSRFESHFGEIDLGHPTGTDNDRIDADLAAFYSDDRAGA